MSAWYIAWRNLWQRPLSSALSILLIALGAGLVSLLLTMRQNLDDHFERNLGQVDMVIGAKGSALQLIMSAVLHIDDPTGNILLEDVQPFARNPMVSESIPIAYGDYYKSYRILGTAANHLSWYGIDIKEGRLWEGDFEVCLGSAVARSTGLGLGDRFAGSHGSVGGHEHADHPFTVVGILESSGTVLDQMIFCSTQSVWTVHGIHASDSSLEITALLVRFSNPMGTLMLAGNINQHPRLQAAVPAFEISKLRQQMGTGTQTLQALGWILILVAAASVFAAIYQAMEDRRYELAVLRAMGAGPRKLAWLLLCEGLLLSTLGALAAFLLSRMVWAALRWQLLDRMQQDLGPGHLSAQELSLLPALWLCGLLAAAWPAWKAMHFNAVKVLAKG